MYLIGYDIGSSSIKASLLDIERNSLVVSAQRPKTEMAIVAKHATWAEQDPELWWKYIKECTAELLASSKVSKSDIKAIGIAYQMHGLVLVDKDLQILRPSIIWCDSRAVEIGNEACESIGTNNCLNSLLNSPGNFTASKLAWVKRNEADIYKKVWKFMLPGDYIAMKMSGEVTSTNSGLSEGIFYDFSQEALSTDIMNHFGFDPGVTPRIVPTFGEQAELSKEGAAALGLEEGTKITYRAGDQPNNALSLNVLHPGELATTAGTSGVVYAVSESLRADELSRINSFAHVNHTKAQRRIGILLCINGTGILYAWARKNLNVKDYNHMNQLAESVEIGADGLSIIPFGNGAERILNNINLGAHISNLHLTRHGSAHILRAMKEGIAFSFKYGIDLMSDLGVNANVMRAGHSNLFQSHIFRTTLSTVTGAKIELYDTDGSQGAARGAGIGLGAYDEKSAFSGLKAIDTIYPGHQDKDRTMKAYDNWKNQLEYALSAFQ